MALIRKKKSDNKFDELSYYLQSIDDSGLITLRTNLDGFNVLDHYTLTSYNVDVYIAEREGIGYYLVNEPPLSDRENRILMALLDSLIYRPTTAFSSKEINVKELEKEILKISAKLG
ncbi:type II secretion system protein VirB, partial [Sulfolobus sp. A20-N-F6]